MITLGEYRRFPIGLLNRDIPNKATVLSDIDRIRAEWIASSMFFRAIFAAILSSFNRPTLNMWNVLETRLS